MAQKSLSSRIGNYVGNILGCCLLLVGTLWGLKGCVALDYATDGVNASAEASKACDYWDRYWDGLRQYGLPDFDERKVVTDGSTAFAAARRAGQAELRYKPLLAAFDRFADTMDDTDPDAGLSAAADVETACAAAQAE